MTQAVSRKSLAKYVQIISANSDSPPNGHTYFNPKRAKFAQSGQSESGKFLPDTRELRCLQSWNPLHCLIDVF
jgi:hypothetical protein